MYHVLALKYRPKNFKNVVGQKYVKSALINSLNKKILHHAYLFIGTRGVGKTTISRILAKSLNCKGINGNGEITSTPCNICNSCISINEDNSIDYIEMDAASNRGIEEIKCLLEQSIYVPSNSRYKIYMIDEIHMLTSYAFNAMLKILENPPKHIKFIFATTEVKKIPSTILSRCLQFNLRKLSLKSILKRMKYVLKKEKIKFEKSALILISRNSYGSMRDALTLVDQVIYYIKEKITLKSVQNMLGVLDDFFLIKILYILFKKDIKKILFIIFKIEKYNLSCDAILQNLSILIYNIALIQTTSLKSIKYLQYKKEMIFLASKFSREEIQIFYQIVIHGRKELYLAPDEYTGLNMTFLRMLVFYPNIPNIITYMKNRGNFI